MKEWWHEFFIPIAGEVMFLPRAKQTESEVIQVLRKTKLKSGKVLDLACGEGRHSVLFATRSFEVTGLDYSKSFLRKAKKNAIDRKLNIHFLHGDMRDLRPHFSNGEFDLVVSLYNSFGYFENRRDDRHMLEEVFRVLRPGGQFVLNTLNASGVRRSLKNPVSTGREPIENVFMIDKAQFDERKNRTISHWTIVDARKSKSIVHRLSFHQNVYSFSELKALLKRVGFKVEDVWGVLGGGSFDPRSSWHQTIVAKKPGSPDRRGS